jgi:hypothetical protein
MYGLWLLKDLSSYYLFTLTSLGSTMFYQTLAEITLRASRPHRNTPTSREVQPLAAQDLKYLYYRWLQKTSPQTNAFPSVPNTQYVSLAKTCFSSLTTLGLVRNPTFGGGDTKGKQDTLYTISLPAAANQLANVSQLGTDH